MIKLRDILKELKSIQNIDKIDTTKPYTIIWNNGDLVAMSPGATPPMVMGKIFPMMIDPSKKIIKLQDYDDWSSFKDILKMQQAVKDMLRAKLADMTWKVDIPMSDVKKNIGSLKIVDFLKSNPKSALDDLNNKPVTAESMLKVATLYNDFFIDIIIHCLI